MPLNLDTKTKINLRQIFEIFKFEIFLQKKRYLIMFFLGLLLYNLSAIFLIIASPPNAFIFTYYAVGQNASFLMLFTIFFAGYILADEFDKKTALTNFTKTNRDNFFVGKSLAAYMSVIIWIGPIFLETLLFSLILYGEVSIVLFFWFGYYCLVGATYVAIYLLCSAIFRSGGQAMSMGFMVFISLVIAFGICGAFFGLWYAFPIYAEIAAFGIFFPSMSEEGMLISVPLAIIMLLCYFIPCITLAYIRFKTRDV